LGKKIVAGAKLNITYLAAKNEFITFQVWPLENDNCDFVELSVGVTKVVQFPPLVPAPPVYENPAIIADSIADFNYNLYKFKGLFLVLCFGFWI
jgi:hypothetical protein